MFYSMCYFYYPFMLLPYEFPRVCTAFVPVVVWADTKVTKDKISETFD